MSATRTSGDALADRRFAWATEYRAAGDLVAAAGLVEQALERAPDWAAGWFALGDILEAQARPSEAASAFRRGLALDPADAAGAGARLARLGELRADGAISNAHIAALFDDYAARFEDSLLKGLAYRAPALLRAALSEHRAPLAFGHAIDLGCGTGLAASALAPVCASMDGVDLSAAMLGEARRKGLYRSLCCDNIAAFLARASDGSADLVLAADVFVYIGNLAALFRDVARVLGPDGLFAFTVQRYGGKEPFILGPDLRYAHAESSLRNWASAASLTVRSLALASTRMDAGRPVPGLLAVLAKSAR